MNDNNPKIPDNRRRRNLAVLWALLAFCAIVFVVTIVKMGVHS